MSEDRLHVCTTILLTLARVILTVYNSWTFALRAGVPHLLVNLRRSAGHFPALYILSYMHVLNSSLLRLMVCTCVLLATAPLHVTIFRFVHVAVHVSFDCFIV